MGWVSGDGSPPAVSSPHRFQGHRHGRGTGEQRLPEYESYSKICAKFGQI